MDKSVKELREVWSVAEANRLIKEGWICISAFFKPYEPTPVNNQYVQYAGGSGGAVYGAGNYASVPVNPTGTIVYIMGRTEMGDILFGDVK